MNAELGPGRAVSTLEYVEGVNRARRDMGWMMPVHTVSQGECLYSIATDAGLFWETVWKDPENEALRAERSDPNLLLPGDKVFVRPLEEREETCAAEAKHRFKRKGVPANLKVRILINGEPIKNTRWSATIDGKPAEGATDADGLVELFVRPNVPDIRLALDTGHTIILQVRHLDPIETISGVQGRLNNLGYDSGPVDNIQGPITTAAIKQFQTDYNLLIDGIVGPQTRGKLKEVYGC